MKHIFLFIFLSISYSTFSQEDAFSRFVTLPNYNDLKNAKVKTLNIDDISYTKQNNKIDTSKISTKIEFLKNGLFSKITTSNFNKYYKNQRLIEFDKSGRPIVIFNKRNDSLSVLAKQFFSNSRKQPDCINIYEKGKKLGEQYINHFKNNLLVKQEYFLQDTLKHYHQYTYDNKRQVIKEKLHNTPNGFGITWDKSITGDKTVKNLFPNDSTLYSYKTINDTLITIKNKTSSSFKEITKKYTNKDYILDIKEEYFRDFLERSTHTYTYNSKDSITILNYSYYSNKEKTSYYKIMENSKFSIYRRKSDFFNDKEEHTETTQIETILDSHKNWIKKIYSKDNFISKIVTREIEYYD
ncbi:hypothetical protein EOD40_00430 [Flavobacterium sufflavum]|uniref:Uncharacterized protein n=1 Tax=Flavobacterium sufflavum TaxID=1921138 RepID=A0A437L2R7_9FLAO|nr:hypothetical protein [Flavobacterium sufflavum]RVT79613.1 hypothetical protein EOD40_00430 [Flavobacterium sufflavum]